METQWIFFCLAGYEDRHMDPDPAREIDPVLFILLLTTEQFPSNIYRLFNGLMVNCHVSYTVND